MRSKIRWSVVLAVALGLLLSVVVARAETVGPLSTYLVTPCRFLDTRDDVWRWYERPGPLASRYFYYRIQGTCGVPQGARAAILNLTATGATSAGHLAFWTPRIGEESYVPKTSTLNFAPGRSIANTAIVELAPSASDDLADVGLFSCVPGGTVHVVIDVIGYLK